MKRALLISISLVLALAGWTTVCAEDGFYVIAGQKANYAPVPKTGQITPSPYALGDDGTLQKGVAWPTPRFTDNNNGTVTDKLTGLMWLKDTNTIATNYPGMADEGNGKVTWDHALVFAAGMNMGLYPLSNAGYTDWRLPNQKELQSLIDCGRSYPALPENHPFTNLPTTRWYWASTTYAPQPDHAWIVDFDGGSVSYYIKSNNDYAWYVRGGK